MRNAILLFAAPASFMAAAALLSPAVAEDKGKGSKSVPSISEIVVTKRTDVSSPKLYDASLPKLYPNNTKPGSSINSAPSRDKVESKGENIRRVK
jgi:hypothetical protein